MSEYSSTASDVGIIGVGSSHYDKLPSRMEFSYLWEAASEAVTSAGLAPGQIDGLAVSSTTLGGDNAVTAAEYLGLELNWADVSTAGGAGSLPILANAVRAVCSGAAKYVLCVASGRQDRRFFRERTAKFNRSVANYLAPHGFGGMNALFAMVQRKHSHEYGTQTAQLGKIAVDQRVNAKMNDRALLQGDMSLDDYLNAPLVADPLRLYDCVLPCSGAEAVVIGPLDTAAHGKGIRIAAYGERHNTPKHRPSPTFGGWAVLRDRLFADAHTEPGAMDFVQVYDDYPIMVGIQLEDLGFCPKGEIGSFLDRHSMTWNGSFPLNTGGGQLSCGQAGGAGGMIGLTEAARQLRGEAGRHQVPRARIGLVSGYGMVGYGHGLSASAMILRSAT